jgi:deoxyribonuclease-4
MSVKKPKIGGHVSAVGGLAAAVGRGLAIGAECIQVFGSSPREWSVRMPAKKELAEMPVYLHAPYLVNLASPDKILWQKSIQALGGHLKIAEMWGARGLIFHVGSGKETDKDVAIKKAAEAMKVVLKNTPGKTQLIIENTAGGGQKIGATVNEIATLMKLVKSPRVKVCIDTAHAFEAGELDYSENGIKNFFDECDEKIGIVNIVALHLNDSKTLFNSHNDRHENIGEGQIGLAGFKRLAKEKRLWDKDWLLEVPGFADDGPDARNVAMLKSLFTS